MRRFLLLFGIAAAVTMFGGYGLSCGLVLAFWYLGWVA